MIRPPQNLEPAERNPAQLRKTALILVAIMIIGSTLVTIAYRQYLKNQPFSPQFHARLNEYEPLKLQEANTGPQSLNSLSGQVWTALALHTAHPEKSQRNTAELQKLLESLPPDQRPQVLLFFIDTPPDQAPQLAKLYPEFGNADSCWRIAANHKLIRDTLKKGLKIEVHVPKDPTQPIYAQAGITLIDKNRHLRGWKLDNDFDFQALSKMEAAYQDALKIHPPEKLRKPAISTTGMRQLLRKTLLHLQNESRK